MTKSLFRSFLAIILFAFPVFASPSVNNSAKNSAKNSDIPFSDVAMEEHAQSVFRQIRCVVCQGETIADSHASVASDMRRSIREQIAAGTSDAQIKSGLTAQYGDSILMKPPLKESTILLWFGPWLVLLCGALAAYFYFRSSKKI